MKMVFYPPTPNRNGAAMADSDQVDSAIDDYKSHQKAVAAETLRWRKIALGVSIAALGVVSWLAYEIRASRIQNHYDFETIYRQAK